VEARQAEAELGAIAAQLREVRQLKPDPGVSVSDYIDGLLKRRAELLNAHKVSSIPKRAARASALDLSVLSVAAHFGSWTTVWMPYFAIGWDSAPDSAGTLGRIGPLGSPNGAHTIGFPGSVDYYFWADDTGETSPHSNKYWVLTYSSSFNLPEPAEDGAIFFRFRIRGLVNVYRVGAYSADCDMFAWIGATPDITTLNPYESAVVTTISGRGGSVLTRDIGSLAGHEHSVAELTAVSGSFPVQKGKIPAMAFIYSVRFGLASGSISATGYLHTALAGSSLTPDPQDLGRMEYRFEPDWWIKSVENRITAAVGFGL
jgi:hypothetical protein